ncbi:MAG: holo-ACP synthase [Sideroxydans sp.]|nr:holo-ACP synthase [Sideroxydans sp.]
MIFGIGTDIVEYARIETLYARHGVRFARRVLSDAELIELKNHAHPARFLAKRFAAKEALAKAIGSGLRHPVTMPRITVSHDALGKPVLQFDATLRQYLSLAGVRGHHLSISDERSNIIAFVVLEQ